jgi:hypothetical protein
MITLLSCRFDTRPFRQQVERQLGSSLLDSEWRYIVAERYPEKFFRREVSIEEVCSEIRSARRIHPAPEAIQRPLPQFVTAHPKQRGDKPSPTRQAAISILIAESAREEPDLQAFRREVLGGKLLDASQLGEWIEAQATRDGPATLWLKVPLPDSYRVEFGNDSPRLNKPLVELYGSTICPPEVLEYALPDQPLRAVAIRAGGLLFHLRELCEVLASRYGWLVDQTVTFVLTDAIPLVSAIDYETKARQPLVLSRLLMTVDPSLSPREVSATYKRVRTQILGRRYRTMSQKHIQLALFTVEHKGKRAKQQMQVWNRQFRKWKYGELSNFSRDCEVAKRRLLDGGALIRTKDVTRDEMLAQLMRVGGGRRAKITLPPAAQKER